VEGQSQNRKRRNGKRKTARIKGGKKKKIKELGSTVNKSKLPGKR